MIYNWNQATNFICLLLAVTSEGDNYEVKGVPKKGE